ncbi:MAG: hypothetical protein ABSG44_18235 [Thermodesulfobacteriota bacterium]|jgi:hypothetical protein
MKRVVIASMIVMAVCGSALGAALNLKATWTPPTTNSDGTPLTDLASYKLYRTDGTRTLISTIQAPSSSYNFSVTVADQSAGTLTFVITAVDTNSNESVDSAPASYPYNLNTVPPSAPKNLTVQKQ